METIFDHNVTKEEFHTIMGCDLSKERFLSFGATQLKHYELIYELYDLRNDSVNAQKYLDLLPDNNYKYFELLNRCLR